MKAFTLDAKAKFSAPRSAENEYRVQLRRVAKQVGHIVSLFQDGAEMRPGYKAALSAYSESLVPWAQAVAARMIGKVSANNYKAWRTHSRLISKELKASETLPVAKAMQAEQVVLITSMPIEAAERAQSLAMEAVTGGRRAADVAAEIARTEEVTASRATLIARTEVARASSIMTQARAQEVDSTHYIWRTSDDDDVRESHAEMEGQVVAWDEPPTLSDGTVTHAGQIYNCRCYPEPIIDGQPL